MREKLLLVLLASLVIILYLRPIDSDGDFFQHVNIGRFVWQNRTLPHYDDLTFTASGREYIGYAWLTGVVFYLVYSHLGVAAINLTVFAVALVTFGLLGFYLRLTGVSGNNTLLTLMLVAPVVASRWPSRPEIITPLILIGYLVLDRLKQSWPKVVFLYPLLTLLFVNLYGSGFPAAAVTLAIIGSLNLWQDKFQIEKNKFFFYWALLACFPAALVNGYGIKSLLFILNIPKMTEVWGDWAGIIKIVQDQNLFGFSGFVLVLYFLYGAYFLLVLFLARWQIKKYPLGVALALAILLPFLAIRQRGLAAILSAPLLASLLDQLGGKAKWTIFLGFLLALASSGIFLFNSPPGLGGNENIFPSALIRFIKENGLSGRVFNTQRIGSFLSYNLYPKVKTFSDTRDELFIDTGVLEQMGAILSQGASLNYLLRKYQVDFVVGSLSDGLSFRDLIYDPAWALVYFDGRYSVFVPRKVALSRNLPILKSVDLYSPTGVKTILR